MKIKVTEKVSSTTCDSYPTGKRFLESLGKLKKLGFEFSLEDGLHWDYSDSVWIKRNEFVEVEFHTAQDLLDFAKEYGEIIITSEGTLEIYDDHRE